MPHANEPTVIPIMGGRLVLIAERYGTPPVLVTTAVQELGYPAKAFSTGTDVFAFLKLHPGGVQCLLADLGLPDMDGGELAECARDLVPGIRVVLMVAPDHPAAQELLSDTRTSPVSPSRSSATNSLRRCGSCSGRPSASSATSPRWADHVLGGVPQAVTRLNPGADPPRCHAAAGRDE
jgi:CheY-like chemotaxis protein